MPGCLGCQERVWPGLQNATPKVEGGGEPELGMGQGHILSHELLVHFPRLQVGVTTDKHVVDLTVRYTTSKGVSKNRGVFKKMGGAQHFLHLKKFWS